MTLRVQLDPDLETKLREYCRTEGIVQAKLLRRIVEPVIKELLATEKDRPKPIRTVSISTDPAEIDPIALNGHVNPSITDTNNEILTAEEFELLTYDEKIDLLNDRDAKLSPEALELVQRFADSIGPDDEDDEIDDTVDSSEWE